MFDQPLAFDSSIDSCGSHARLHFYPVFQAESLQSLVKRTTATSPKVMISSANHGLNHKIEGTVQDHVGKNLTLTLDEEIAVSATVRVQSLEHLLLIEPKRYSPIFRLPLFAPRSSGLFLI
jgi:hypothetical protein